MPKQEKQTYVGYGYHGGGRPKKSENDKKKTFSISGTPSEIDELKSIAETYNISVSKLVFEAVQAYSRD